MSFKIPRADSTLLPEAEIVRKIQFIATERADRAAALKASPTWDGLISFYHDCVATVSSLSKYAGNQRLITWANANHPTPDYDVSIAFNGAVATYQGYIDWFKAMVGEGQFMNRHQVVNGVISEVAPNTTGLDAALNAIIDSVEDFVE